jgi:hypothetical protein
VKWVARFQHAILLAFVTAHNLLNRWASAEPSTAPANIVMSAFLLLIIGDRRHHGGVAGAIRADRLWRSTRCALTPDGLDTVRPTRP